MTICEKCGKDKCMTSDQESCLCDTSEADGQ